MNLIIFDRLANDECEIIKNANTATELKFKKLEDLLVEDIFRNYEKITIYLSTRLGFVSNEFVDFIEVITEIQPKNTQINVVFVEKYEENAKISIDWINFIKRKYGLNINILAEISRENLKEEVEFILKARTISAPVKSGDNNVEIYTDGACSGNPGAGGWGAVLIRGDYTRKISGYEPETTNNKMEITAVIKALEMLKAPCKVELYSDSAYVVNAIKLGWLNNWKSNGWIGSDKKSVKNIEYWKRLDELMQVHSVNFNKVKGHSDNKYNNMCDELATDEIVKHANDN